VYRNNILEFDSGKCLWGMWERKRKKEKPSISTAGGYGPGRLESGRRNRCWWSEHKRVKTKPFRLTGKAVGE